jgi:hypothetical protein
MNLTKKELDLISKMNIQILSITYGFKKDNITVCLICKFIKEGKIQEIRTKRRSNIIKKIINN